jgi:cytochrome c
MVFAPENMLNAAGGFIEVRIDAPDGPVIGRSKYITPVKGKDPMPAPIVTPVKLNPTQGFHDVYFIFKNESAPAGQSLFIISNIKFDADGKAFGDALTMK